MQKIDEIYRERLKLLIQEAAGGSQTRFAALIGKSPAQISQWVNASKDSKTGKPRNLDRSTARLLELKCGKPEGWMDQPIRPGTEEPAAAYGSTPILAWEHEEDLPPGEFVMIPRLDVRLSAGNGHEHVEISADTKSPVAFRADWMRKQQLRPRATMIMYASGDSMEDRIHDGDLLVVDTSKTEVKDGGVYALWYDGGERVKRLFRLPGGGLRIHSDNSTKYADIQLSLGELEHVRIIGRVVLATGMGGL